MGNSVDTERKSLFDELLVERFKPKGRRPHTGMGAAATDNDLTRAARRRALCAAMDDRAAPAAYDQAQ